MIIIDHIVQMQLVGDGVFLVSGIRGPFAYLSSIFGYSRISRTVPVVSVSSGIHHVEYRVGIGQIRFHIEPFCQEVFFFQFVGENEGVWVSVGFLNIIFNTLYLFESVYKDRFELY
mgnify:CR=1 FL=1